MLFNLGRGAPLFICCLSCTSVGVLPLKNNKTLGQNIQFRRANKIITDRTLTQILLAINSAASWKNIIYDSWAI